MARNDAKKHHYVPQFFMRRFACANDKNKVMALACHREYIVGEIKSVENIGHEERLHEYLDDDGTLSSIENDLNNTIEMPFSRSPTWLKICHGNFVGLDESDRSPLYGFARHLQLRNLETLRFIQTQCARYRAGELEDELTNEERDMYAKIASDPSVAHGLFRFGAMETRLPADANVVNLIICRTTASLRSSTNPVLPFSHPGGRSIYGEMFDSLRTWWLSLDRHCGMFIIAGGPSGFSNEVVQEEIVRAINRRHLVQLLKGCARYLLADDGFLRDDLEWAGLSLAQLKLNGFRYRKANPSA